MLLITKAVRQDGFSIRRRLQTYTPASLGVFRVNKRPAKTHAGPKLQKGDGDFSLLLNTSRSYIILRRPARTDFPS
jgi:hypothetical protein